MDNLYLFIIWNSALFARSIIKKDLEENFEIVLDAFVNWSNDKYHDNLEAFYGRKISNVKDKINVIGKGPFNVLVVKDNNPEYGYRHTNDGDMYVNTKIFDKKALYRKYTGGSFRVHNSTNSAEFNHDMVVLFGSEFGSIIYNDKNEYNLDTKTVEGFSSKKDVLECLNLFGDNKVFEHDSELLVFAKYRLDIERFLNNTKSVKYTIYGEKEGDIPNGMFDLINENTILEFLDIKNEFDKYIETRLVTKNITALFEKYGFIEPKKDNTLRENEYPSLIHKVKRIIKYKIAKIKYGKK